MSSAQSTIETADREIVITRVLHAPRERVFAAFSDPEHIGTWWGPNGFRTTTYEMDVRPGGVWRFMMHGPDGTDYPNRVEYIEVVRPERITYKHGSDQHEAEHFRGFITLEDQGDRTRVTLRLLVPTAAEKQRMVEFGAVEGGEQTLERLAEHLAAAA